MYIGSYLSISLVTNLSIYPSIHMFTIYLSIHRARGPFYLRL